MSDNPTGVRVAFRPPVTAGRCMGPVGAGETSGAASDEPAAPALPTIHEVRVAGEPFGIQTVFYTARDGSVTGFQLPGNHPILENFHRGLELYFADLEGAAREWAQKVGVP